MGKKNLINALKAITANLDEYEKNLLTKSDEELRIQYPLIAIEQMHMDRRELIGVLREHLRAIL